MRALVGIFLAFPVSLGFVGLAADGLEGAFMVFFGIVAFEVVVYGPVILLLLANDQLSGVADVNRKELAHKRYLHRKAVAAGGAPGQVSMVSDEGSGDLSLPESGGALSFPKRDRQRS